MKQLVKAEGPLDAKIVLLGDAPSEMDFRLGRPFASAAGEILNSCLSSIGIIRSKCYVTNVIKEVPPDKDISKFILLKGGKVVKQTPEYEAYEQELFMELAKCSANVIVAMGPVPFYAMTRMFGVTKRRGSIYESATCFDVDAEGKRVGRKVMCSLNPATAIMQYTDRWLLMHDFERALDESKYPEVVHPKRTIRLRPSFFEAVAYMQDAANYSHIGFDIEVVNEETHCFAIAKTPSDIMCIPLISNGNEYFDPEQERIIWLELAKLMTAERCVKVGQNINFDASFLFRKYNIPIAPIEDTMVCQAISMPDFPKGLDMITSLYTRENYYKDEGKKWSKLGGTEEDFWSYNAKDAAVCLEAMPKLLADVNKLGNMETVKAQTEIIHSIMLMQERGMKLDTQGILDVKAEAETELTRLEEEFRKACGCEVNFRSPKALANHFYITRNQRALHNRKTGKVSTDVDALKRLARRGLVEADLLLQMRKLDKLKGTYYEMSYDEDGRLRCAFNPVGTKQGRLSSGKTIFGTGGNFQNMPYSFRKYMLFDEGYVGLNFDLAQAENRIVAYIAPDMNMIHAFENKIDIHKQTAGLIFHVPYEEVSDEKGSAKLGNGQLSQRDWGKKANHGLNYDLSYKAFALIYEIPESDGRFVHSGYHAAYPGVHDWHRWVQKDLQRDRTLTNCFGRKRKFLDRWGDDMFKEAYSFNPQSTVADKINRDGLIFMYDNPVFEGSELLNQVHDSIVFQIPLSLGWKRIFQMANELTRSLQKPLSFRGRTFSIPADCAMGMNFGELSKVKFELDDPYGPDKFEATWNKIQEERHKSPSLQEVLAETLLTDDEPAAVGLGDENESE